MKHSIPSYSLKYLLTISMMLAGILLSAEQAFSQEDVMASAREAFKIGSSKELVKCLGPSVEVKMDGARSDYNRTQAEMVFRDFFKKYPPTRYELSHQGSSPDGSRYVIDKYYCAEGSYVIWILVKESKGEAFVNKVNILKE